MFIIQQMSQPLLAPLTILPIYNSRKGNMSLTHMSLNYGQSNGIINDRLLYHMDILLEVKYHCFTLFLF